MIDVQKSITMDHVKDEVMILVDSLIVKLQHIADRYETIEYTKAADEYLSAISMNDNFHTYTNYSDYALNKAGLFSQSYKSDKFLIPVDKRAEVAIYQREYVLATYEEKNNYYRMLAGLPDYGDDPIYLTEYIPDVDITKPLHEMEEDDITILKVTGVLSTLIEKYPDKKYLRYLEKSRRIPIYVSRKAGPYAILYIKRDRSKQGVSDMFIGIYKQCSEYIMDRFYEESYKIGSPYYDGFIGLFILSTTIQRYVTNYFHKLINRDFYDKDIIKLFLQSYEIPYYDEIPLSYMQKIAKNLNRLLMYKATDKVFTDIFEIFDLENIEISNYILLKDTKLNALNEPIMKYEENTEVRYSIDTVTYHVVNDTEFIGSYEESHENNVKSICKLDNTHTLTLLNNGTLKFVGFEPVYFGSNKVAWYGEVRDDYGYIISPDYAELDDIRNFDKMEFYYNNGDSRAILTTNNFDMYIVGLNGIEYIDLLQITNYKTEFIDSVIIDCDNTRGDSYTNVAIAVNYYDHSDIYIRGEVTGTSYKSIGTFKKIFTLSDDIIGRKVKSLSFKYNSMCIINDGKAAWVCGKNNNNRFMKDSNTTPLITTFTEIEDVINIKSATVLDKALIFIMDDGTVRYTGSLSDIDNKIPNSDYLETNILYRYKNISTIKYNIEMNILILMDYYNKPYIIGIKPRLSTNKYERNPIHHLLFKKQVTNSVFRWDFVRDIFISKYGIYVTCYRNSGSEILYSTRTPNLSVPYIGSTNMLTPQNNKYDMNNIVYNKDRLFFTQLSNKPYSSDYSLNTLKESKKSFNWDYTDYIFKYEVLGSKYPIYLQKIKELSGNIFLTSGTKNMLSYRDINGYGALSLFKTTLDIHGEYYNNKCIVDVLTTFNKPLVVYSGNQIMSYTDNGNPQGTMYPYDNSPFRWDFVYKDRKFSIEPKSYQCGTFPQNKQMLDELLAQGQYIFFRITDVDKNIYRDIYLKEYDDNNVEFIDGFTIVDDRLIITANNIYYLNLDEFIEIHDSNIQYRYTVNLYDELNEIRTDSQYIDGNLVIYNIYGGLTFMKNFKHIKALGFKEQIVDDYYVNVFADNNPNTLISKVGFNDNEIMIIRELNDLITYKPVVNDMYNLKFVEVPIETPNLGLELSNTANYLDYEMVVNDDRLWGGDGDKNEFVKKILESEFNYAYSKYISVNSRYNITQLNFELCYMFKMLVDLKENEKYLSFDVPYVGDVNLFDCIVGLFAITCMKFEFDGVIMDTTTKSMSVLGFNFEQDMEYLTKVIEDANLYERDPSFKKEDIEIFKAPKLFKEAPEVINLYLDNKDVMDNIYKYKYNAKTIQEYNAYKRIEYASVITKYSTDMYRIDGELPKTYMEYLSRKNINLYEFIKETNPENMVQQIDILLVSLDNYLKTDKFKYLFLNVPSLSMDNIRKFIYYLVDIFKSYTVDLKALNIIYHVDDKRIHNIKMILQENFYGIFEDFENLKIEDFINDALAGFNEFEKVKMECGIEPDANLPLLDFMMFNNKELFSLDKTTTIFNSLREDFGDFFEEMSETIGYSKTLEMVHRSLNIVMREYIQSKMLDSDKFELHINGIDGNDIFDMILKEYRNGSVEFKSRFVKKLLDNISLDAINDEKDYIKFVDLLENSQLIRDLKDIIPFDMYDNIEYIDSIEQHDNKINYKDRYYFIRKE